MAVGTALVTVEEFLRLQPPRAGHYELHHGEVILATAPKWGHQRIQDRLAALLRSMAGDRAYVTKRCRSVRRRSSRCGRRMSVLH